MNFEGFEVRECGEHRTLGQRAWCFACSEYCYPESPCSGCLIPQVTKERDELADENKRLRAACQAALTDFERYVNPMVEAINSQFLQKSVLTFHPFTLTPAMLRAALGLEETKT